MKKIFAGFFALFALVFLAECSSQKIKSDHLKKEWMMVEFQDFTKEMMVANKARLNLTNTTSDHSKFSANMGCNSIFGILQIMQNGKVKFSDVGSTMMFCDKSMDLESAFSKALPKITNFKIEGHFLTLSDNTGKVMKFIAADWD